MRKMPVDPSAEESTLEQKQVANDRAKLRELQKKNKVAVGEDEGMKSITGEAWDKAPESDKKEMDIRLQRLNAIADEYRKRMLKPTPAQKAAEKDLKK